MPGTNQIPGLSIRSAFLLIFTLLIATPLALFWAWPVSRAMQNELDQVHDRHLLLARNLGAALQRYHRDVVSTFEYFATKTGNENRTDEADQILKNLHFRHICIADSKTGKVMGGFRENFAKCPENIPAERFAAFKNIAVDGQIVLSGVMPGPDGQPTIFLMRREEGHIAVGALQTGYFVELGKTISFGDKGHAAIVDQYGKVLAHPLPSWIAAMKDISKVSAVSRMLAGETGVETFYSPALKDDMIAGFTTVRGPGWGVMIPQPVSELRQAARGIQLSALSVFAIGILIAVLVALLAAIPILRALTAVIRGANLMEKGKTDIRLDASGRLVPRELRTLLTSFNSMAESVSAAQKSMEESEKNFRNIIEGSIQGVFIVRNWELQFANQALADIFGYETAEEILAVRTVGPLIAPDERARIWDYKTARENGEYAPEIYESKGLRKDGSIIWVEFRVKQVEWHDTPSVQCVVVDITERKQADTLNLRLARIVEDSINEVFIFDAETLKFLQVNASACRNLGYTAEELAGMTPVDLKPEFTLEQFEDAIAPLRRGEVDHFRFQTIHRRKDGSYYDADIVLQQINSGERPVFAAIIEDITDRKLAEEELIQHRDHLQEVVEFATQELKGKAIELELALAKEQELNKLQREFVSMASHEFRTPLSIIDATAQRMKSQATKNQLTPEDAVQRVEKIRDAVKRMTRLMESTLDAARMEEGRIKVKIGECDLRYVVLEVIMHQIELSPGHNITCDLNELPDGIQGDSGALNQVITNLMSNAVKYSPDAPDIEIKGRTEGDQAVISVRDHGMGIDEDELDRIGERFFRARTSTGITGTGIGLNLAMTLVRMHGGWLSVESKKGKGSTFTIRLPIAGPDQTQQVDTRAA